jgi:hypothetical protein
MPTDIMAPFIERGILGLGWAIALWLGWLLYKTLKSRNEKLIEVVSANTAANTLLAERIGQGSK